LGARHADTTNILWFKTQFEAPIQAAVSGTPLTVDFPSAIACQETGSMWGTIRRKNMPLDRIVALCVGDTLDVDKGRQAFPQTRADLEAAPRGKEMFALPTRRCWTWRSTCPAIRPWPNARASLSRPCVFQLDLRFFRDEPDHFLNREYESSTAAWIAACELKGALRELDFDDRTSLTDREFAMVGIVYNTGRFSQPRA
jgi:hypothetical protein